MASSSGSEVLSFCGELIRIEPELLARLGQHVELATFLRHKAPEEAQLQLVAGRHDDVRLRPFVVESGARGAYRWTEAGIAVHPQTDPLGLSFALRGLFSRAVERLGGCLVHASCVSWDGKAALITGASGAGKSTLARWSLRSGATLLSDEVVGVLPDGTVLGTPFRSDPDLKGSSGTARLAVVATLRHDAHNSFEERPAHELIARLTEQAFDRDGEVSAGRVLRCAASAIRGTLTGVFACRNDISAGLELRGVLAAAARSSRE